MIELIEIVLLFAALVLIFYSIGAGLSARAHWMIRKPQKFLLGFFAYFFIFQICAECTILYQMPLHVLSRMWLVVLAIMLVAAIYFWHTDRAPKKPNDLPNAAKFYFVLMLAAIACQIVTGLLVQRNVGWDFAYYMGNLTTSVSTDTMYLYDGNTGNLLSHIDLRYALSGFYMHSAVLAQLTGINAMVLHRLLMGVLDFILADAILYLFAMKVFLFDKKKSYILVTVSILLMVCWDVYDTSAQFLFLRNYEAKSYCANVVLPMVVYLVYCIWKDDKRKDLWQQLFVVCSASVGISMSSILLVPVAVVVMMAAHILLLYAEGKKQPVRVSGQIPVLIRNTIICLLFNGLYLIVYFLYTRGLFVLEVMR